MEKEINTYKELMIHYHPTLVGNKVKELKNELGENEWNSMLQEEKVSMILRHLKKEGGET